MNRVEVFNKSIFEVSIEIGAKVVVSKENLFEVFDEDPFYQAALRVVRQVKP